MAWPIHLAMDMRHPAISSTRHPKPRHYLWLHKLVAYYGPWQDSLHPLPISLAVTDQNILCMSYLCMSYLSVQLTISDQIRTKKSKGRTHCTLWQSLQDMRNPHVLVDLPELNGQWLQHCQLFLSLPYTDFKSTHDSSVYFSNKYEVSPKNIK